MIQINGKHNNATIYTNNLEQEAFDQIKSLCDCEAFRDSKIRIMPDVHSGKGCCIGTTMTLTDKVVPSLVGVDIGCGVLVSHIDAERIDYAELQDIIKKKIPSGMNIHETPLPTASAMKSYLMAIKAPINIDYALRSLGTLGGGNHFIEIDEGENGLYLVIHSGSRHLGVEIANHYQKEAARQLKFLPKEEIRKTVEALKAAGRESEIATELAKLKQKRVPDNFAYVSGDLFRDYIHDMEIAQAFAWFNRCIMASVIRCELGVNGLDEFQTVHNYIDTKKMILRKGAVSAKKGEKLIIPINMRDGALICKGKGNPDWNFSAPHGAGRLMSRAKAKELSLDEYKESMKGIWTESVSLETLDECPMAYKSLEDILSNIHGTVDVIERITPAYNYKAKE